MTGKDNERDRVARAYHPAKFQIEVALDASCSRSLRWDASFGFACGTDECK